LINAVGVGRSRLFDFQCDFCSDTRNKQKFGYRRLNSRVRPGPDFSSMSRIHINVTLNQAFENSDELSFFFALKD